MSTTAQLLEASVRAVQGERERLREMSAHLRTVVRERAEPLTDMEDLILLRAGLDAAARQLELALDAVRLRALVDGHEERGVGGEEIS